MNERIIKSRSRVQQHGEVFTPKKIVNQMLDTPEIKKACESLTTTFLEPAAGEGAFLVAILERKLNMVSKKYNSDLTQYENFSLLALTTLYGIELLEDNAQTCVMNMYEKYYDFYREQINYHNGRVNQKVLKSAKKIISLNIVNGNFLTRRGADGDVIIFSEWQPINLRKNTKNIRIQRTEYTFDEIYENAEKENGTVLKQRRKEPEQLDIFSFLDDDSEGVLDSSVKNMNYKIVKITDIYKEEMEEVLNG